MTKKQLKTQLQEQINDLKEQIELSEERWEMLKDYLKVKEKDFAVLVEDYFPVDYSESLFSLTPLDRPMAVKKTKLIKIKK